MDVSAWVWFWTILGLVALLVFDYVFHVREPHAPTLREAAVWSAAYVGIAIAFGVGVFVFGGATMGSEYFAGYITEKAGSSCTPCTRTTCRSSTAGNRSTWARSVPAGHWP